MPYAAERGPIFLDALNSAMAEFHIDTLLRQACFLAQVAHESGSLRYTAEIWGPTDAQRGYEGRADLGNTHIGDGRRFLGRGLLQITGRANTTECLKALGRNVEDVGYLETPLGASRTAAWYWHSRGLNDVADQGSFGTITKKINGGFNGLDDRIRHYVRCRKALNI
jgi:putative chitinase